METQMILNHKSAIELLVEEAGGIGFNWYTILNLHAILSDGLLPNPDDCGRLRHSPVAIGGSVYMPIAIPQKLEENFAMLLQKASEINDPFEQAFFAMVHLAYLQPFMDVNKRVSRLAANIPLIRQNLAPLSFIDLQEELYVQGVLGVYEMTRVELLRDVFVWAYERSCQKYLAVTQNLVPPDPFRLKYRKEMAEAVRSAVLTPLRVQGKPKLLMPSAVEYAERERFADLVKQELSRLHEGNIARFRIAPADFRKWKGSS
jgi:fido (protein-threonine AMPylation protein)